MDIIKLTSLAVALVTTRAVEALNDDNYEQALEEVLLVEQGANLLGIAIAKHLNMTPEDLDAKVKSLIEKIKATDSEHISVDGDAAIRFLSQRNKADLN